MLVSDKSLQRGLDLPTVSLVIQFDFAKSASDFLLRISRTGRLGKPGKVTNFIRPRDEDLIVKILEKQ